jgi:hypothetical protein
MPTAIIPASVALKSAAGSTVLTLTTTLAPGGYQLVTWTRPARQRRRRVQQGDFNPGEVELSSTLDVSQATLGVRIVGTSLSDVESRYDALVAAAEQGPGGLIVVTFGATSRTWHATGSPNITSTGGRDADILRWTFREDVTLAWPVDPFPT